MIFAEAMAAVTEGHAVRRDSWGPRRAIRVMNKPWWEEEDALLFFDRTGKGDVPPYPYAMTGDDVRAADWSVIPWN